MSETQNNPEDVNPQVPADASSLDEWKEQQERLELAGSVENGAAELLAELDNLPQAREVILPVIMRKGEGLAVLGDAVFNPETNKMVVSFNTEPGRNIAEFIGSGMLAALSFTGHMHKRDTNGG